MVRWAGRRGSKMGARRAKVTWAVIPGGALAACATAPPDYGAREDRLAAAGFVMKPADTPAQQVMLGRLPPHQFLIRTNGDTTNYVYADPLVCDCLYVGTQQAYDTYRANQLAQNLASEQQLIAVSYADAAWSWDAWGVPWAPGSPPGW
jgi:hypothetical protein